MRCRIVSGILVAVSLLLAGAADAQVAHPAPGSAAASVRESHESPPAATHIAAATSVHAAPIQPRPMRSTEDPTFRKLRGPLFGNAGPRANDPQQGGAGDCYFIAAMSAVAQRSPDLVKNAITELPGGNYRVRLYKESSPDTLGRTRLEPVDVVIDKTVAYSGGAPAYVTGKAGNWPAVLEKAFAAVKGSYSKIGNGGFGKDALEVLTGKRAEALAVDAKSASRVVDRVEKSVHDGRPVLASTRAPKDFISTITLSKHTGKNAEARDKLVAAANPEGGDRLVEAMGKFGLVPGHEYTVLGVGHRDGKSMVVLRNPWGSFEPAREGIGNGEAQQKGNGIFAIPEDEFALLFDEAVIGADVTAAR